MAGFGDVLGALLESQLSGKTGNKLKRGLSSGGGLEKMLTEVLGGQQGSQQTGRQGGGMAGMLGQLLGGGSSGGSGGLAGMLGQLMGSGSSQRGGGINVGALESLAGQILGGGKSSSKNLGGGLMALLGSLAMGAMTKGGQPPKKPPLGLRLPETPDEEQELESAAQVVLMAMINAAKADGHIDPLEAEKIVAQLDKTHADKEVRDFVYREMAGPLDVQPMIEAARKSPELAAQVYAATLLAVEVDTPEENRYLAELQKALGLPPQVASHIEQAIRT